MSRTRTALTHLWPSLLAVAVAVSLTVFAWYPDPFYRAGQGVRFALLLIVFAGLVGPALTWLVYKDHRFKFRFDVTVIVMIQLAAIGWATYTLYEKRPYFMVFAVDRFEVLSRGDVDPASITDPQFLPGPASGPRLVFAAMPTDRQVYAELVRGVMFEGGPDIHLRPELWHLFEEKQAFAMLVARPLEDLRNARPGSAEAIDRWVHRRGKPIQSFKFAPASGRFGDFAAVLRSDSGEFVGGIDTDPWLN